MICGAPFSRTEAEQIAFARRQAGYKVRIYPRTIRAEGLADVVYVVVSDTFRKGE